MAPSGNPFEFVKRPTTKGLERTLGWLMQYCRLVRDYEALPQRSHTMILWAMTNK